MRGVCEASLLCATGRIIPLASVMRGAWCVLANVLSCHNVYRSRDQNGHVTSLMCDLHNPLCPDRAAENS
jgi:hypothetical protein